MISSFLCSYLDPLVDCSDTGIFLDLGIKISLNMKQWKQKYQALKTRLNTRLKKTACSWHSENTAAKQRYIWNRTEQLVYCKCIYLATINLFCMDHFFPQICCTWKPRVDISQYGPHARFINYIYFYLYTLVSPILTWTFHLFYPPLQTKHKSTRVKQYNNLWQR